jgi:hypothetical protein
MFPTDQLIRRVVREPAFMYNGLRKIVQNLNWECPKGIPDYTYADLGYTPAKPKQLERNYINAEELERVKTILEKRKGQSLTSVALSMRGAKKDSRSMGWCMLNVVITRTNKTENVEVHYRSTELIFKFGADLVFLPTVFERIGVDPKVPVRFHFTNAFLSGVFLPTYLATLKDPTDFLRFMRKTDPQHFQVGTRFLLRSAMREDQRFPYSPENQQHKFMWRSIGKSVIQDIKYYLTHEHKKFGRPMPVAHESGDEE